MGLPEWPELWVVGVLLLGHIGVLGSRVKPGLAQAPLQYSLRSLAFSTCPPQAEKEEGREGGPTQLRAPGRPVPSSTRLLDARRPLAWLLSQANYRSG